MRRSKIYTKDEAWELLTKLFPKHVYEDRSCDSHVSTNIEFMDGYGSGYDGHILVRLPIDDKDIKEVYLSDHTLDDWNWNSSVCYEEIKDGWRTVGELDIDSFEYVEEVINGKLDKFYSVECEDANEIITIDKEYFEKAMSVLNGSFLFEYNWYEGLVRMTNSNCEVITECYID